MSGVLMKNVELWGEIVDLPKGSEPFDQIIDGKGLIALPAFTDVHVHFRDPGQTHKEDLLTGARAAAAGGYGWVICEPNTRPVLDTADVIKDIQDRIENLEDIDRVPISISVKGALTVGQQGKELVDIPSMWPRSSTFSSDGEPITDTSLLLDFWHLTNCNAELHLHCEETPHSSKRIEDMLGFGPSMAREPELVRLALSALAQAPSGSLHIQHVSMAETIALIADAKQQGLAVTCEVSPHHLLLCEQDIPMRAGERDANYKMNPPLRSREDMLAMRRALAEGVIDLIATDHAPHAPDEKALGWDKAPFGVIGLETAYGACMSLVHSGDISFETLASALTDQEPFSIYQDVVLVDPNHVWTVDPDTFYSKSRNCPFAGMTFKGKPMYTIAGGRVVMAEGEVLF